MNPDFRDILCEFTAADVEFLLVGAYAMATLGLARSTGDIDLKVPVIGRDHLPRNKRATGRPRDRIDAEWLESRGD